MGSQPVARLTGVLLAAAMLAGSLLPQPFADSPRAGIELFQIVLGLMCLGRLSGWGESQNEAKSRRFGMDRPSRAFYEGVNPKTILNNSHEYTPF